MGRVYKVGGRRGYRKQYNGYAVSDDKDAKLELTSIKLQ